MRRSARRAPGRRSRARLAVTTSEPPPGRSTMSGRGAQRVEGAVQIDGEDSPPLGGGHFHERLHLAAPTDPGIREARVHSPEHRQGRRERSLDGRLVPHVTDERLHPTAVVAKLLDRRRVLRRVGSPDTHGSSGGGQSLRHAEPDSAVAAGDKRHLATEIERAKGHIRRTLHCAAPGSNPLTGLARGASGQRALGVLDDLANLRQVRIVGRRHGEIASPRSHHCGRRVRPSGAQHLVGDAKVLEHGGRRRGKALGHRLEHASRRRGDAGSLARPAARRATAKPKRSYCFQ